MCSIRRVPPARVSRTEPLAVVGAWPRHGFDGAALRRLAPYLLLAVLLHALLGLGLPAPASRLEPPPLRLSWREPPPAPVVQSARPPEAPSAVGRGPASRSLRGAPSAEPMRVPPTAMPLASAPVAPPAPVPAASAVEPSRAPVSADLLDSSRRMARDIGREAAGGSVVGGAAAAGRVAPAAIERAALPELERALRRRPAGEERLDGGILRITTEAGRVYCLKPPPDFARDGPGQALAVPTNCP